MKLSQIVSPVLQQMTHRVLEDLQDSSLSAGLENTKTRLLKILDVYEHERDEIRTNPDLTGEAKIRKERDLAASMAHEVDALGNLHELQERLEKQILQPANDAKSDGEKILKFMRGAEIRASLRGQDPLKLEVRLRGAMDEDGVLSDGLIDAVLDSPIPLISRDLEAEIRARIARKRAPKLVAELEDVRLINATIKGLQAIAKQHIK